MKGLVAARIARLNETRPGYQYPQRRIVAVYVGLMLTIFLGGLDATIVATALPHVVADIGGVHDYSWVFGAYILMQTISVPIYGSLGDAYGRRRTLLGAILLFVIASALCGTAQNMPELIAFRALQGIGAGGVTPLAYATVADLVPPRDRGRYQGFISSAFLSASIAGPVVGGVIVDHTTWRWIFLINIPVGALALLGVIATVPHVGALRKHRVDYVGAALLASGMATLLLALVWSGAGSSWLSPRIELDVAASVLLTALFVLWSRRVKEPILPFEMLRQPIIAYGASAAVLMAICQIGAIVYVPLFAQGVIGTSGASAGIVLTPLMLGGVTGTVSAGQIVSRTGRYRLISLLSPVIFGIGMFLLSRLNVHASEGQIALDLYVAGVGTGFFQSTSMIAAQNAVSHRLMGSATSFMQFARLVGTAFGPTIFGLFVIRGLPADARGGPGLGHRFDAHGRAALASSIHPAFLLAVALAAASLVLVAIGIEEKELRREVPAASTLGEALPED